MHGLVCVARLAANLLARRQLVHDAGPQILDEVAGTITGIDVTIGRARGDGFAQRIQFAAEVRNLGLQLVAAGLRSSKLNAS